MNDLKKLDDASLLSQLKALVAEEREITTAILKHLQEVQRRRLFSDLGYPSLFAYCVQGLGYSESAAQRRIEAARLLNQLPELETKIQNGALSLSVAAQAATFFRQEKTELQSKRTILQTLEGKSAREAQRALANLSTQPLPHEKTRALAENKTELRLVVDAQLMEDLEKLKGLLAHSHPNISWAELIRYMATQTLKKIDPAAKPAKSANPLPTSEVKEAPTLKRRRYIPAATRRAVWQRDQGKCVQCGSRHALQLDHRTPYCQNGTHELDNLQLTCRNCNQRRAIHLLGAKTMSRFLHHP